MLKWFPLLLISIAIYNLLIFGGELFGSPAQVLLDRSINVPMFSGDIWMFRLGDLLVLGSLCLLFFEIVKSTRTGSVEVLNHALSMMVFVVALVEFLLVRGFSNTTFFFIVVMAFFDVVAGFTISIVAAKRDLGTTHGLIGTN
ncbi:MAG: hypothetical protein EXR00_09240 [Alphaproteobacteria bacterium]|nr:hypothetical protein [Alphaproteobacteria bacterium]